MDLLKNLDNMITAEEFLKDKFRKIYLSHPESFKDKISEKIYLELHVTGRVNGTEQNYPEMMIEFAKLYVKEIQKLQKSKYYAGESGYIKEEEFIEILNDII